MMLASWVPLVSPKADCHSSSANEAAVIAHEAAIATQATRSPCCRQRAPKMAATAATIGGMIIQRSLGAQTVRTCQP